MPVSIPEAVVAEAEPSVARDLAVVGPVFEAIVVGVVVQMVVESLVLPPVHRLAVGFAAVEFPMELPMLQPMCNRPRLRPNP